jgi:hypothetical protein
MARIFRDSSVLNQFGSPSINSNILALRPAFGQTGRLFVDTTNNVIYRDTGTSWDLITGGVGSIPNLQQVTTVGNTTNQGINQISNNGIFSGTNITQKPVGIDFAFAGYGFSQFVSSYNANSAFKQVTNYTQNNFQVNVAGTTLASFINPSFNELVLRITNNITFSPNVNNSTIFGLITIAGNGGGTLTVDQGTGARILSPILSKLNYNIATAPATISHYAGFAIYGPEGFSGTQTLTLTNFYSLYLGSSTQFAINPNFTNRWGVYQAGSGDKNYMAGVLLLGTTTQTGRQLVVNGLIENQTTVDTNVRVPSGKYLPIYVKSGGVTTLYYITLNN